MSKQSLGWVYILTNPAFKDGMIKIGFTSRDTPQERAAELSGATGVPTAFTVVWAARMPDAQAVEGKVHKILQTKRSNHNREFFECSVAEAIDMIETVAGKTIVAKQDNRKKSNQTTPQNNRQPEKVNTPKKTPYSTTNSSTKRKTPPSTKAKNKGGVLKFLLGLAVVFLVAMLVIGWFVEKRETAQPVPSQNKNVATATATPTPPPTAAPVTQTAPAQQPAQRENAPNPQRQTEWRDSVQDVQLAWDKISADIQKDLHAEQQAWERKKAQTCEQEAKMGGHETEMDNYRMACEIKWNAERTQYLRGFSIR